MSVINLEKIALRIKTKVDAYLKKEGIRLASIDRYQQEFEFADGTQVSIVYNCKKMARRMEVSNG